MTCIAQIGEFASDYIEVRRDYTTGNDGFDEMIEDMTPGYDVVRCSPGELIETSMNLVLKDAKHTKTAKDVIFIHKILTEFKGKEGTVLRIFPNGQFDLVEADEKMKGGFLVPANYILVEGPAGFELHYGAFPKYKPRKGYKWEKIKHPQWGMI